MFKPELALTHKCTTVVDWLMTCFNHQRVVLHEIFILFATSLIVFRQQNMNKKCHSL